MVVLLASRFSLHPTLTGCSGRGQGCADKSRGRHLHAQRSYVLRCVNLAAGNGEQGSQPEEETKSRSALGAALKRKQKSIVARLENMKPGEMEESLAAFTIGQNPSRLIDIIAERVVQGRTTIIAEISRLSPSESPESVAQRGADYIQWGADALALCTDEEFTPDGLADLRALSAATRAPVLRRDWILHPFQIVDTAEAGGAAVSAVYSILGKGMLPIARYAESIGIDTVVEVINSKEVEELAGIGFPLYGINISVGLSLAIPGFREGLAKSLLAELPSGAASIVGVSSLREAQTMREAGAFAVFVKKQALQGKSLADSKTVKPHVFLEALRDAMTGDD